MPLVGAQLDTLKAAILADGTLSAQPNNDTGNAVIAAAFNALASPDFFVYRPAIPIKDINDQIQWSKLTPADAVPTDTALNASIWQARSLACQGKQFNLQTMLMGQTSIDGTKSNIRAGLQDALTNVPSGASGASQAAGWVGVRDNALAKKATRAEKLYADTSSQNGSTAALAALMTFEGSVSVVDVENARNR